MMPNMMNGTAMSGLALFWTGIVVLFFLLLIAMLIWLFIRWMSAHHTYAAQATRPHPSYQDYQQGYPPQASENSQEEKSYNTSPQATYEQPSICDQQEMQPLSTPAEADQLMI